MSFVLSRNDIPEPSKHALKDQVVQIIGRGSLRDCNDSRISREHASVATQGETLILRALHQKSCFYRKSFSDVINVLSYGESVELFHGDSFGLLPETNWYELVYIKKEDAEGDKNNAEVQNKKMQPDPRNDEQSTPTKRPHTPNQEPGAKKIKTEPESPMTEGTVPTSNIAVGETQNNTKENFKVESSQALTQDEGVARSNNQGEPMDVTETDNDITNAESLGDVNLASDENKEVDMATDSSNNDVNISKDASSDSLGLNNPTDSDTDVQSSADEISKKVVKKEPQSPTKESAAPVETSSVANSDTEMPRSGEEMVVKKEPGVSGANDVKTEPQSTDAAQPGTSKDQHGQAGVSNNGAAPAPAQPQVRPRERCLYGANCYRKNPQHKVQFGHPGDADYDACERAACPYGAQCYRTEPRHWITHTHPDGTLPPQRPRNAKKRQKVTPPSESEDSASDSPPEDLIVQGKRQRKAVKRDVITFSDDDDEPVDPYATDESDDWKPT